MSTLKAHCFLDTPEAFAICAASLAGLAVEEFTPSEIKQAVTGSGNR